MIKKILLFSILLLTGFQIPKAGVFDGFTAGDIIEVSISDENNIDDYFTIEGIDESIKQRIIGKSYPSDCKIPLSDLRYLKIIHKDLEGQTKVGELICNASIADELREVFKNLYLANYPIESVRLIDDFDADDEKSMRANNTSCFCYREIAGSNKLSKHALGLAIDINPLYNPYVKNKKGRVIIQPANARQYADRYKNFPYKISAEDACYKAFVNAGFEWGGNWKSLKDYQHFEK